MCAIPEGVRSSQVLVPSGYGIHHNPLIHSGRDPERVLNRGVEKSTLHSTLSLISLSNKATFEKER